MLDPLAGVRLRSDLHHEIASENHAIAEIEKKLAATGPILLRACALCGAIAVDECRACDESVCEDCAMWSGCYTFCPDCVGGAR